MATENISTSANCKHCGGTIIVEVTGVPVDMPSHQGRTGELLQELAVNVTKRLFILMK